MGIVWIRLPLSSSHANRFTMLIQGPGAPQLQEEEGSSPKESQSPIRWSRGGDAMHGRR
jgi:hypothetical protein